MQDHAVFHADLDMDEAIDITKKVLDWTSATKG